jgi:hypothetical protein
LLETVSFTLPPGSSGLNFVMVGGDTGTYLGNSGGSDPALGTLPVIDYTFTVDNAIVDLAENHTASEIIGADFDAVDADGNPVTFSLLSGTALFSINASTGQISLTPPGASAIDYESATKSYELTVQATDSSLTWVDQRKITLNLSNVNDNAPVFISGGTGSVDENAATTTTIYTAVTTDADNLAPITYSLDGTDKGLLNITGDGVVTLKASADYEAQKSYSFNVIAHDGDATHDTLQAVVVSVKNLNDNVPVFTSGGTGFVDDKAAAMTVVYSAVTTDADNLLARTYSLDGKDAGLLDITTTDGVVTLKAPADYAAQPSYSFNVLANDGANTTPQAVVVSVNKLVGPTVTITSNTNAVKIGETATITFTFSEDPGASFISGDITTTGGNLGALSGSGKIYSALFTPTEGVASGNASITVADASYSNAAGVAGSAGTTPAISIDTLAPSVLISSDKGALKIGETAEITFTFSEDPGSSFVDADITTTGGTLGALSGSGVTRTALFTPSPGVASVNASITVANASYTDPAGNTGSAGTTPAISIDTLAPVLAITSDKSMVKSGETATITFTFSEDPGSSFVAGDIETTGGTLGALSGSGTTRTAIFTPTAGIVATASITVADSKYSDPAGNNGSAGTTPLLNINTVGPTVAISSDTSAVKIGETAEITFTFSKDPGSSFTDADITTKDGTLGAVSGSGTTYTALFTPTAGLASGIASITVADSSYTDPDGNAGSAGTTPVISIDTLAPTVSITSNKSVVKSGETAEITFTFSEAPGSSFVADDITTTNGTLGALSGSGLTRTAIFTPPAGKEGSASITVADTSYIDAAGNSGAGIKLELPFITVGPTVAITSNTGAVKIGETATITFTFSEDPGTSFTEADISTVGGTLGALSGSGTTRIALFTPTAGKEGSASITVADSSYTDPDGNEGSAGPTPVISIDTLAPTVAITSNTDLVKIGETAAITFTFSEDPGTSFVAGDITTTGGILGTLSGSGLTRTSLFTPTAGIEGSASITVANASYSDAAGNSGGAGTTPIITIHTGETPTTNSAPTGEVTISGTALEGQSLIAGNTLGDADGLGLIGYQWRADGADISGATDRILLLGNAQVGQVITVKASYTDGHGTFESVGSAETLPVIGSSVTGSYSGLVQDGYLENALVWVDTNNNGQRNWVDGNGNTKWDAGEGESWTLTDSTGQFAGLMGDGIIRITANPDGGTIDISTGKAFTGSYSAPSGSTVVNPLTTLVVAAGGNSALVKAALGLDAGLDLTTYDPLAESSQSGLDGDALAMAIKVESAAIQIANIMDIAMSVTDGAGGNTAGIAGSVASALITAAGSGTLNLANSTVISNAIVSAAQTAVTNPTALARITNTIDAIAAAAALVNSRIEAVSTTATAAAHSGGTINALNSLTQIVSAQIVAQDTASQAFDAVSHNNNALVTLTSGNVDQQITAATSSVETIFVNHLPTGAVTITGTAVSGQTLVAGNTLHDVDGLGAISYQWQDAGVDISGAVSDRYIPAASNIGHVITVKASYTDGAGTHESVISAATEAIAPASLDTTAPSVVTVSPTNHFTGAGAADNIVLIFNEAVERGSGTIVIHSGSADGAVVESYDALTSQNLTISGSTMTLNPSADFVKGTHYYVTFGAGSVNDYAGNHFSGSTYDFTVADPFVNNDDSGLSTGEVLAGIGALGILAWVIF